MRYIGFLLFTVLLSVGCSGAKGPPFAAVNPEAGHAVVYVYRPSNSYQGSAVTLKIDVDGKRIGNLRNQGYIYGTLAPGEHVVRCKTESESLVPLRVEAGESYYIEAEVEPGWWVGRPRLTMVPRETGELAIRSTRLSVEKAAATK